MLMLIATLCFCFFIIGMSIGMLGWYVFGTPTPRDAARVPARCGARAGSGVHALASICALLRLPFALLPWLIKRMFFRLQTRSAGSFWHSDAAQAARMLGEGINLCVTAVLMVQLCSAGPARIVLALAWASVAAESLRLAAQRGQMIMSAAWQWLPHRALAVRVQWRGARLPPWARRYCEYYALGDEARLRYVLAVLRARAAADPFVQRRLRHLSGFRIVPDAHYLRSGHVRDVARGEIFVHRRWTNDPWLLIGLALRRAPWMFDPRELPRPFAYRTQANHVATAFVLRCACYSPPYAWYQFGHETKAATHEIVLHLRHAVGCGPEQPLRADGVYAFGGEHGDNAARAMWTDDQVIDDMLHRAPLSALQVAERYTYPQLYVVDVLLPRLAAARQHAGAQEADNAASAAAAVSSGASQCG